MNKSKRKTVIAGNWKMNKTPAEAKALISDLLPKIEGLSGADVVLCVPFCDIQTAVTAVAGTAVKIGAQNIHFAVSGAYTGEISASMLCECGVEYVIVGHSERRQYFGETDVTVNLRTVAALKAGLRVILCVGEKLEERERGITAELITMQLDTALFGVTKEELANVIIAYEPVWAIGTGKTATSEQADEVCALIRSLLANKYGNEAAQATTIQYGGSMNAANAAELLSKENVDGGLIGGASLKADDFAVIVKAAQ
jgi:triosephosphate isomerase (TIM)